MSRRITTYVVALVFGVALVFAFASTALSSGPWCPQQEQTAVGTCAGPVRGNETNTSSGRVTVEIRPLSGER